MNQSTKVVSLIIALLFQSFIHADWSDISEQVVFSQSTPVFDRTNRVLYSIIEVHNISGHAIYGPARLRVFDSTIPFSEPISANENEVHIEIPGVILNNESKFLRVNFQLIKGSLDYSLALEHDFVYVASTGSDATGDGSKANPLGTIQYAIDQANDGDAILVHEGRYIENINFMGKAVKVGSMFMQDGNYDHISNTIIDGNRMDSVVVFERGEGAGSGLVGLSIINGYASENGYGHNNGGGIRVINSTPQLDYLYIFDNEATREGGGIYFNETSLHGDSLIISNSNIKNNRSGSSGGGIRLGSDIGRFSAIVKNCVVSGNHSSNNGGGMFLFHIGKVENTIILGNNADHYGGGIFLDWGSISGQHIYITNTTTVNNHANIGGGGIGYVIQGGVHTNSIIWNNSPNNVVRDPRYWDDGVVFNHSLVSPLQPGVGNLDTDPLFIANPDPGPDSVWGTDDDYGDLRMHADSPLIDQGDTSATDSITDYSGAERVYGDSVDIGAYEWHPE
jgi:hypothetical protein